MGGQVGRQVGERIVSRWEQLELAGSLKVGRSVCGEGGWGEGGAAAESGGRKKTVPQKQTLSKGLRKERKSQISLLDSSIVYYNI